MKVSSAIFLFSFLLSSYSVFAQEQKADLFTLSGYLKDTKNGEVLIGANIYVQGNNALGATTNLYGFYFIVIAKRYLSDCVLLFRI